jgi:hypothetical protein
MLFTHGRKVYTLSPECVVKRCRCSVSLNYDELLKLTGTARGFCAEAFMSAQVLGHSIAGDHVLVIATKAGLVWCSQLSVRVSGEAQAQFGIDGTSVGSEFVWPWNPGRATKTWLQFVDAEKRDGHFRSLSHLPPTRRDMSATLAPELVEGCVELPWAELTNSQRFFLSHLDPTAVTLCMSSDPEGDARFVADAKRTMTKRRKMQGRSSSAPLYMTVADDELVACEQLDEANSDPVRFFGMRRRDNPSHEAQNMFPCQRVVYADWAKLPQDVASVILESIASDAFTSSWTNYRVAEAVADLRLVCRDFRASLDASLERMWTANTQFSRCVLQGGLPPPPASLSSIALAAVVSTALHADTWCKLAVLRRLARGKRDAPFTFHGTVPKRVTFGEANRDDMQELQRLNERARVQRDVYFF